MAWIALSYRGVDYTAAELISISKKYLEGSENRFQSYEIYEDCDTLAVTAVKPDGEEIVCQLSLDELQNYSA